MYYNLGMGEPELCVVESDWDGHGPWGCGGPPVSSLSWWGAWGTASLSGPGWKPHRPAGGCTQLGDYIF